MPPQTAVPNADLAQQSDDFYLARQPILGRDQHLVAYELLFRSAEELDGAGITDHAAATAAVISHASQLGMRQVVGERQAFVNVDEIVLMSDFIRFLQPGKVILEVLESVKATPKVLDRIRELKQAGFQFALDDVVGNTDDVRQLLSLMDVIKVDIKGVAPEALPALTNSLRNSGQKLLAEKVETVDEFKLCLELGFEYFQGYYFARPAILSGKKITPSELVLLHLIELVNSNADTREIESSARDETIRANLLRLLNTPVAGARGNIESMSQALQVLGRRQLQRWLQILLYAKPGAPVDLDSPLLQMATTRGRLMELMVQKVKPNDQAAADMAFTVGILSLMDALFSMSMADILGSVALPQQARDALLERKGDLGIMLKTVELLEDAERAAELKALLKQVGLTVRQVREIEIAAFDWVNELAQEVH